MTVSSLDAHEIEKFSKIAAEWWDPAGKLGVLHAFNPVRLAWITEQVTARMGRDPFDPLPLKGLRFLDIGCGGGLLCEPMARLGATVVGVDPSEKNIHTASVHADEMGLEIDYRATTAEALAAEGEKFDVILNMEVIEHVKDPRAFAATCASMLTPGGLTFIATLNRTARSFGLAILGAEYVLRWLPVGTHQWERFITPDELKSWCTENDLALCAQAGVSYNIFGRKWNRTRDMSVNYMLLFQKN